MKFRSRTVATILLAALALLPGAARPASAQGPAPGVPILVYHRFGPTVVDGMTVTTPVLEEQLAWLRDHDYRIVPLRSLVDALEDAASPLPAHAVAITTDDGHRSVHSEMLPLIRRYRFPVTLFIYPSAISNASWASRLPGCSSAGAAPSPSRIRRRAICPASAAAPTSWSRPWARRR